MHTELVVRFGYGAVVPWMTRLDERTQRAIAGPEQVVLRTDVPLRGEGLSTVGEFDVHEGETVDFVLTHCASHLAVPEGRDVSAQLADTDRFWSGWSSRAKLPNGPMRHMLMRSVVTLKGLTYAPTGGIVAAPTTSLPESLGGIRNWDC